MRLNGEVIDTLVAPRAQDLRQTTIPLTTGAFANYLAIPYVPQFHAALSPFGHYVSGNGEKLVLTSRSSSGHPLIIESDRLALKIDERERQSHYRNLRQKTDAISLDDIPREKPVFKGLRVDDDGRIWVWLYAASALVPVSDTAAAAAAGASLERWTEPAPVFDVFSAAGEFLGTVELPESSTFAAARGSRVWAIVTDNMDVPRVVRYRDDGLAEGAR
jgi:hypothetical protein